MEPSIEKNFETKNKDKKASKSAPFLIIYIFLERYTSAGVLIILPLFLHYKINLDKNLSTSMYHWYEGITLLFTVAGAVMADAWLGLYKSIIIMTGVYIFGLGLLSISMIDALNFPIETFIIISMLIMAVGCGCIKSNTSVFGGNQHKLPEEEKQLQTFFSSQYFAMKCGSLLARFTMPILRQDVNCLGKDDCYPLAFGVPGIVLSCALFVLLMGHSKYIHVPSDGNMLFKVCKCITHALLEKRRRKATENSTHQHWLDYAHEKYGKKLVLEIKFSFKILTIFLTVPMFWALIMQQCSRWIFQATKMNGNIGIYNIKPDQMVVLNSFLVVVLIPIFDKFLYPLLEKIGFKSMLHRMILGFICTILAFLTSAFLDLQVERSHISILWQFPQYFIISTAEVFASVANINFAYSESPASMKPVIFAFMYLTTAAGDFIVAIISGISIFQSQAYEYIFFAFLMVINVSILCLLTSRYKSTDHEMIKALGEEEVKNLSLEKNV